MVKKNRRAITILHEMSHMWFGNLVTMKWWDDLWLNESFATFMSHLCLSNAKGLEAYTFSWDIFSNSKEWGLDTDGYPSTHPVAADVKDTEDAENIFDGISYAKGASIMKQLLFFISEEVFKAGVQRYFEKYAYQNTKLEDLISTLQSACDDANLEVDLIEWCDSWIKTSGFNIFESNFKIDDSDKDKIEEFKIIQKMSKYGKNQLRKQNIQICLFDEKFNIYESHIVNINNEEETIVKNFKGIKLPKAYLMNFNDWGYGKFAIDDYSLEAFKDGLSKISDNLTRKLIYNIITSMTLEGTISANTYFEISKYSLLI